MRTPLAVIAQALGTNGASDLPRPLMFSEVSELGQAEGEVHIYVLPMSPIPWRRPSWDVESGRTRLSLPLQQNW